MSLAIERIKTIIDKNQNKDNEFKNFALQGGAGSGKTESLKEIISYISQNYPDKKIACITHTNVAVDEIVKRVGDKYNITTIHSFLNSLIKDYKKNLKDVIHNIFCVPNINIECHKEYKKNYEKYSNKLFSIDKTITEKAVGKREYDKSPINFNSELNEKIRLLNLEIIKLISLKDHNKISYNESRFDSFEDLSFSHDSLLTLSYKLCERFQLLPKIISDKYDFIFIDEYQDTNEEIIKLFVDLLPDNKKTTIGLFGDSMQGIYDDGVGDIEKFIGAGKLVKIDKEDNFRCSKEVIDFINILRNDDLEQELALKAGETKDQRKGEVKFYYTIYGKKPNAFSSHEDKENYLTQLNNLISTVKSEFKHDHTKILMLTNKSISTEVDFKNLYDIFNERYSEVKEEIENELSKIQISDIRNLCKLYRDKDYNALLVYLKKNGFQIKSIKDKKTITEYFEYLINTSLNLSEVLTYVLDKKIIKKSERHIDYENKKLQFLDEYSKNTVYQQLEVYYLAGSNTKVRLKTNHDIDISEDEFDEFEKTLRKKNFYINLFSNKLKFREVLNYYCYLDEETEYITMHKTKGSGIKNVIVVLDEYFWNKYDFKSIYDIDENVDKRYKNQKLFYVACSRTISNLAFIRLVEDESEEKMSTDYFQNCEIIKK